MHRNHNHIFWFLLPSGGPGLHDPCEKEEVDTLAAMTKDQAELLTYTAQVKTLLFGQSCHVEKSNKQTKKITQCFCAFLACAKAPSFRTDSQVPRSGSSSYS